MTSTAPWLCVAGLDDDTLRSVAQDREIWATAWLRQCQVYMGTECRLRRIRIAPPAGLAERCVEDHGGPVGFPTEDMIRTGRGLCVSTWLGMVERGVVPIWTERGPPDWLEATLWAGR